MIEKLIEAVNLLCPDLDPMTAWMNEKKRIPLIVFGVAMAVAGFVSVRLNTADSSKQIEPVDEEAKSDDVQDMD